MNKIFKNTITYLSIISISSLLFLSSCAEKFSDPKPEQFVEMDANTTIAELKAMYEGKSTEIFEDIIIEGIVNSTDQSGNLYKNLYIQDETGGIEIKVGKTGLYNDYKLGQTLYIKAEGRFLGNYEGMVQLGAESSDPKYESSYLDVPLLINSTIIKGKLGDQPAPIEINDRAGLNSSLLGKYVTLKGMTYKDGFYFIYVDGSSKRIPLDTWAVKQDNDNNIEAAAGNQNFVWGTTQIVVRTSGYARFALDKVPAVGSIVDLTGILTKYRDSYQLVLLSVDGVKVIS